MKYNFNVTKEKRKELVNLLGEIWGVEPHYRGVPSCAYEVGHLVVDVNGTVDGDLGESTLQTLSDHGFVPEGRKAENPEPLTFKSNAKEIQHYAKIILSGGNAYSAKELKEKIAQMTNQSFSDGTYAGALRELVENDCQYSTEERGIYKYTAFDGDPDLLPFISILVSAKSSLFRKQDKTHVESNLTVDKVSHAIRSLDALIAELWKAE